MSAGLPYLRLGQGPPLVMAVGGAAEHANPAGFMRWMALSTAAPFAAHVTVYVTSRKPGLAPGSTMADIAADCARAIDDDIGGPAAFHGTSAGARRDCSWRSATRVWSGAWSWWRLPAGCHRPAAGC